MVAAEQPSSFRSERTVNKVKLAVLDDATAAQLEAALDPDGDLELAWSGRSSDELLKARPEGIKVVLASIDLLGDDPVARMNELVESTGAELGIALYSFAKRELLNRLSSSRVRTLRSPLNLPVLRCQMMSIIARNLLSGGAPTPQGITPPRYSAVQLGKLQQISSAIDCECPNHLATLLQNLSDFEAYSRNCESRNEEDAEVHRMLYESTARARALMERAMDRLVEHEKIAV